ncbi:hypothetical protein D3C78_558130 [compost metagenome]
MAAQCAKAGIGIAVQHYGTVDTVLKHFRASQRAVFGDMADHNNRNTARFGKARKIGRGFTHLGHAARRGLDVRHVHHLNGVDHHQLWLLFFRNHADLLDAGFREHIEITGRQAKPVRAHRHLLQGLFARDVQGFHLL